MGDPAGAAKHILASLKPDGTWMIVEPFAHDSMTDNLNPVGQIYYSFSTLLCTPCSRSQEVALCLGAQAGEVPHPRRRHLRRLHPLPPRHRNPLQHRLRSQTLSRRILREPLQLSGRLHFA